VITIFCLVTKSFIENPPLKATEPKIIRECHDYLSPIHQTQVRVGTLVSKVKCQLSNHQNDSLIECSNREIGQHSLQTILPCTLVIKLARNKHSFPFHYSLDN